MIAGPSGARVLRLVYVGHIVGLVATEAGSAAILGRGLLRIRGRRLGGQAVGGRL